MSPSELELLVLRAQAGEEQAHGALVSAWHGVLLRQAGRLLDDRELARDAAQDAWAGIVRGLRRLDDPATFPAWALRIVTRRAIDLGRRRQRAARVEVEAPVDHVAADGGHDHEREEQSDRLRAAVAALDRDHRVVVELHYLEGLSMPDIARVLDLPVGTVKSRAFHARQRLRKAVGARPEPRTH